MENQRNFIVGSYTEPIEIAGNQILQCKGKGLYSIILDTISGKLTMANIFEGVRNPSYIAISPDGEILYCVNELKEFQGIASGSVSAFRLNRENGTLRYLNSQPSYGTDPCHLVVDNSGRFLIVANYSCGFISVFPIKDNGSLGKVIQVIQHRGSSIHPVRQQGPHPHSIIFDPEGRFVYITDLGLDKVMIYRFHKLTGKLMKNRQSSISTQPGSGPRHMIMHPESNQAYVINELNSTISAYFRNSDTGELQEFQTISTLPDGFKGDNIGAAIRISSTGKYLFASNRGHNSLICYVIHKDGTLIYQDHTSTKGEMPRDFIITEEDDFLIVSNQNTDNLNSFKLDIQTGHLSPTGYEIKIPSPVCIQICPV